MSLGALSIWMNNRSISPRSKAFSAFAANDVSKGKLLAAKNLLVENYECVEGPLCQDGCRPFSLGF